MAGETGGFVVRRHVLRGVRVFLVLLTTGAMLVPVAGTSAATLSAGAGPMVGRSAHNDTSPAFRSMRDTGAAPGWAASHAPFQVARRASTGSAGPSATTAAKIPSTNLNFDGVGNGFTGPSGTFTVN